MQCILAETLLHKSLQSIRFQLFSSIGKKWEHCGQHFKKNVIKLSKHEHARVEYDIYTGGIKEKIKLPFYVRNWIKKRNHVNSECNFLMNRIDGTCSGQG